MIDLSMKDSGGFGSIGDYYLHEVRRIVRPSDTALKTDLYNEERSEPISGGIIANVPAKEWHAIEICDARVRTVKEKISGSFVFGDIRTLPYEAEKFDCIVDLSTIDHVMPEDMPRVVSEYARVIKPRGTLLLISWIDPLFKKEKIVDYNSNSQYYHSLVELCNEISRDFDITSVIDIVRQNNKDLVEIIAGRRP